MKGKRFSGADSCSRRLVPRLKGAGYDVRYHEFDGPHTVPEGIAREALEWFARGA
jgi:phospholipase/carboxylesterase